MPVKTTAENDQRALALLHEDAKKIIQLIEVQMENLTMPQCPLYEEVLDTQMFGFSKEVDFAVRLGLIQEETGKRIMAELEMKLAELHDAYKRK
ncbi:YlaN family protein [Bacillaceae bacterium]